MQNGVKKYNFSRKVIKKFVKKSCRFRSNSWFIVRVAQLYNLSAKTYNTYIILGKLKTGGGAAIYDSGKSKPIST